MPTSEPCFIPRFQLWAICSAFMDTMTVRLLILATKSLADREASVRCRLNIATVIAVRVAAALAGDESALRAQVGGAERAF